MRMSERTRTAVAVFAIALGTGHVMQYGVTFFGPANGPAVATVASVLPQAPLPSPVVARTTRDMPPFPADPEASFGPPVGSGSHPVTAVHAQEAILAPSRDARTASDAS
jgi:hypothetical protein